MDVQHKKIGIWGFGIVGKAAAALLSTQSVSITIMEKRELTQQENALINQYHATSIHQDSVNDFFDQNDLILMSPGIDPRPYAQQYKHKFITELDLLSSAFTKPIIAITGTVGKTSVTHFLSTLLNRTMRVATAGNIGIGMLDLINKQEQFDCAVLEVSSFQLEYCRQFQPHLAIITNLYSNHLDRHETVENYLAAKLHILSSQKKEQQALLPIDLVSFKSVHDLVKQHPEGFSFFSLHKPSISFDYQLFWIENNQIFCKKNGIENSIAHVTQFPQTSFAINWLIVAAALDILGQPFNFDSSVDVESDILHHRLEKIETTQKITFYNDSKSTVPESTLAAVHSFNNQPIVLIVGGLSKGVDRASLLIAQLPKNVVHVICFGTEKDQLFTACTQYGIIASRYETLQEAFIAACTYANETIPVLFSPSGSSYDLFNNYQERGNAFKKLIRDCFTVV
ncbi:MAG: UDP-N-acetylmuramoylalanine--D-glutamate ligase [Candidatus Dependentiae bacterium ADurb.Bin331]|nr:MAG: UDP-N-acetylmuramoylalanine--D-glutamate ligase [Candidatus Dependentiae bacterium ADurb.Bin331]